MLPEFKNVKELILKVNNPIKTSTWSICRVLKVLENDGFYRDPFENEFPNNNSIFINGYLELSKFFESIELPVFRLPNSSDNLYQYAGDELYKTDPTKTKYRAYSSRNNFFYLPQIIPISNFSPYPSYNWETYFPLFPNDNQGFFIEATNAQKLYGPFVYNNVSKELFSVIGNSKFENKELLDIGLDITILVVLEKC